MQKLWDTAFRKGAQSEAKKRRREEQRAEGWSSSGSAAWERSGGSAWETGDQWNWRGGGGGGGGAAGAGGGWRADTEDAPQPPRQQQGQPPPLAPPVMPMTPVPPEGGWVWVPPLGQGPPGQQVPGQQAPGQPEPKPRVARPKALPKGGQQQPKAKAKDAAGPKAKDMAAPKGAKGKGKGKGKKGKAPVEDEGGEQPEGQAIPFSVQWHVCRRDASHELLTQGRWHRECFVNVGCWNVRF
jgi:hypothetical protein